MAAFPIMELPQISPVPSGAPVLTSAVSTTGFDVVNGTDDTRFLQSFMGLGGTGPASFTHRCQSGVVLGIDVSRWEGCRPTADARGRLGQVASVCYQAYCRRLTSPLLCALQVAMNQTADGTNAVSGLRFLCGDPTCQGTGLASPPPPPPQTATPPAATGDWSPWLGRSTPQSTIGICPCPGYILVRGTTLVLCQAHQQAVQPKGLCHAQAQAAPFRPCRCRASQCGTSRGCRRLLMTRALSAALRHSAPQAMGCQAQVWR